MANNFSDEIMEILDDYADSVFESCERDVNEVAKECVKMLKLNSPKKTGKYASTWTQRKRNFKGKKGVLRVVFNEENYRLTHLLEHGHANVGGGRTPAHPHIEKVERQAKENLEAKIRKDCEA